MKLMIYVMKDITKSLVHQTNIDNSRFVIYCSDQRQNRTENQIRI